MCPLTLTSDDGFNLSLNNQDKFGIWQPGLKKRIINARSETITVRPMFKEAFKFARCLVLATGWFEWDANKTPYYISLKDNRVMAFAGLRFKEKENNCFVILTGSAKGALSEIHHRTPLLLKRKFWSIWLGITRNIPKECLFSPESHFFHWHEVSSQVGNVVNDNASLVLPISKI